jgi:hypothetical protein
MSTAGVRCQWSVVSRKTRSNQNIGSEKSWIPTEIFVNAEIIPKGNGPRTTSNGHDLFTLWLLPLSSWLPVFLGNSAITTPPPLFVLSELSEAG